MNLKTERVFTKSLLFGIFFIAGILRLWNLPEVDFMHDEFSALFRTQYDTFEELIREGVMLNDTHPAGVQVFLFFWVKWFGFNEFWIKLPFALIGMFSIWLIYLIAKQLFNTNTAIIVSSVVAVMQFFVFYSQLARPYSAGLFFSLVMAYGWSRIVGKASDTRKKDWMIFTFGLAASAYMHAFSMLLAILVYLSGFVFLKRTQLIRYLLSGITAALLYSPHIPVFIQQMKAGTIGGWLGPPDDDFLMDFLGYIAHFNPVFIGVLLLLLAISMVSFRQLNRLLAMRLVILVWFLASLAAAWLYSTFRSPVLQFSTLYFTFPFALMALFTMDDHLKKALLLVLVVLVVSAGSLSLVFGRKHYQVMYEQGYEGLADVYRGNIEEFGPVPLITMTSRKDIPEFYLKRNQTSGVEVHFARNDRAYALRSVFDTLQGNMVAFVWTDYAPPDWAEVVRMYYPYVAEYHCWFNAEYFLLSKVPLESDNFTNPFIVKKVLTTLVSMDGKWTTPADFAEGANATGREFARGRVYGPLFESQAGSLVSEKETILVSCATVIASDTVKELKLVMEVKDPVSNEIKHWQAAEMSQTPLLPGDTLHLATSMRLGRDVELRPEQTIRTYLWNPTGSPFRLLEQEVYSRGINPKLFCLFEAF